jgi:hypothetical protein
MEEKALEIEIERSANGNLRPVEAIAQWHRMTREGMIPPAFEGDWQPRRQRRWKSQERGQRRRKAAAIEIRRVSSQKNRTKGWKLMRSERQTSHERCENVKQALALEKSDFVNI